MNQLLRDNLALIAAITGTIAAVTVLGLYLIRRHYRLREDVVAATQHAALADLFSPPAVVTEVKTGRRAHLGAVEEFMPRTPRSVAAEVARGLVFAAGAAAAVPVMPGRDDTMVLPAVAERGRHRADKTVVRR